MKSGNGMNLNEKGRKCQKSVGNRFRYAIGKPCMKWDKYVFHLLYYAWPSFLRICRLGKMKISYAT